MSILQGELNTERVWFFWIMNRELVDLIFRKDFRRLLGFDIFRMVDDWQWLAESEWFNDFMLEAVVVPIAIMHRNMCEIVNNYLRYDPDRFPDPLDQYTYIYENKNKILAIFDRNAVVQSPYDDPVLYALRFRIDARLERFFENILKVGNSHKFDEEELEQYVIPELDNVE